MLAGPELRACSSHRVGRDAWLCYSTVVMRVADRDRAGASFGVVGRFARRVAVAGVALAALLVPAPASRAAGSATDAIDALHATMLAVIRDAATTTYQQRFDTLAPAIDKAYDLDFMGRKSLGKGFDALSADDQKRWLAAFRTYMIANFAGRFKTFDGQKFETLGEEPAAQDTVLVKSRMIDPKETVDLNYRMRKTESGDWKVVDVYLKGTVSELALRRSDFTATLDREGFPALLSSVEAKIADLAAGKAT
ncbi:MAG: phospholipid-binding protein MlaC [Alphaproteobacteria bacterium]